MVPAVSFASNWVQWILLGGMLLINTFPSLMLIGIALFALTTLFSFVTLPVEIDASRRALAWLSGARVTSYETQDQAKDALKWAAYTYVVAALGSLATLLYYVLMYLGATNRITSYNVCYTKLLRVPLCPGQLLWQLLRL